MDVPSDVPVSADQSSGQSPDRDTAPKRRRRSRRSRRRKPGSRDTSAQSAGAPAAVPEEAPAPDPPAPGGPKPSDLAARRHHSERSEDRGPADAPARSRRRAVPTRTEPATAVKLRTVRETSAGGLVLSSLDGPYEQLSAALIGRTDRRGRMMWSLPKGHIEMGETAEQTAIREVAEETGIQGTVVAPLGKIDYWFVSDGRRIHKTVHHYLLRSTGGELSDADYEVAEVAWVPLTELPRRLTYSDERRLARTAESMISELTRDPHRLAQSEAECVRTEPNDYEKAAAARNQRRNEPPAPAKPRRRRRRGRRADPAGDA